MMRDNTNPLHGSDEVLVDARSFKMGAKEKAEEKENLSSDIEKDAKQENGESDYELARVSLSSQSNEDSKIKVNARVPKKITRKGSAENINIASRGSNDRQDFSRLQPKTPNSSNKRAQKTIRPSLTPKTSSNNKQENVILPPKPPSELSEESDDRTIDEIKDIDVSDEAPTCDHSVGTDNEAADAEVNNLEDDRLHACQKIEDMEQKIEKLEEELREVAALEVSLYSVVPEHGSSAHKVHTPARRLSRMYIHACKHWAQGKRATVAKNTVSGLVLIAKSCGNDVSRLTFWLSNTVVLREIISQTFGQFSHPNSVVRAAESNGNGKRMENKLHITKWRTGSSGKQTQRTGFMQQVDDWQESSTFTAALEKIESWIFSRIVESVWWQTLTPHMQSPVEGLYSPRCFLSGPILGDQEQGKFSVNLWKSAFRDACARLCPVRSGGHECGCLPVLSRMVMEQCVSRLDVAMFNAILRESANEMPTDPVSDPIVDPRVLPIPAGNLSFGSGVQLKNSIGNWSRCLSDLFGLDVEDCIKDDQAANQDDVTRSEDVGSKPFRLLNELSDLLMLPKDMLIERAIRKEVCPSIGPTLMTRILCNFTPDEFCLDPVPGFVLEELSPEIYLERRQSEKDMTSSFPCSASAVTYFPPSSADVAEKVGDTSGKVSLNRSASIIQRKGHTSDDDLDDLNSPLTSIIDKSPGEGTTCNESSRANVRYKLLREVWSE